MRWNVSPLGSLNLVLWFAAPSWSIATALAAPAFAPSGTDAAGARETDVAADRAAVVAAHAAALRALQPCDGGYVATHRSQGYTTGFDGRGFTSVIDERGASFGLELVEFGWEGAREAFAAPLAQAADGERLAYRWSEQLEEWYLHAVDGLEHGCTVRERAAAATGPLELEWRIRGGLRPEVAAQGRDLVLHDEVGAAAFRYAGLSVLDANGRALPAGFRVEAGRLKLRVDDRAARYPLVIDPIVQQAYLKASNSDPSDFFGGEVAIDGDTAVVGAGLEDSSGLGIDPQHDESMSSAGAAYVYVRTGTTWSQQAYLKAGNAGSFDYFGDAVAISGDTIVVGAYAEDSSATGVDGDGSDNSAYASGAAYVFVRTGTTWTQQAYLKASNTGALDYFGGSVAIDGDTVAVGAFAEDSSATGVDGDGSDDSAAASGAVYVFVRSGTTWSQQAYVKASNTQAGDGFGWELALSGDSLLVSALHEASNATGINGNQSDNSAPDAGAAYVFTRSGVTWSQQAYIKASNTETFDWFGWAVALDGDTALVGARFEDSKAIGINGNQSDNSAPDAGAAYVFIRSGAAWSQQAYLKASNTGRDDNFGGAVAVAGDRAVVGATGEDSKATGINGSQSSNAASGAGAAYLFARSGATWSQLAYMKASNTEAFDIFGASVAISGDTALIGATYEDSDADTVDGNQADNSASDAGAVYVFDLDQVAGSFATYDVGTAGSGGFVPSATLSGSWFISEDVTLSIRDGVGGAPALLITGFARAAIPFAGGNLLVATPWVLVNLTLGGTFGMPGAGTLDLTETLPDDPAIVGVLVDFQVLVADPAATKKLALSNGAELAIGG